MWIVFIAMVMVLMFDWIDDDFVRSLSFVVFNSDDDVKKMMVETSKLKTRKCRFEPRSRDLSHVRQPLSFSFPPFCFPFVLRCNTSFSLSGSRLLDERL